MTDPWRMCVAGATLRAETNARWPRRDKASDGGIGDATHASRSSDHNPWIKKPPPPSMGIVRATDTDVNGIDAAWFAEHIRKRGAAGDPRLINGGYVIFNRRITTPDWKGWKVYTGTNPHTSHVHVSFTRDLAEFDLSLPWGITTTTSEDDMTPEQARMLAEVHEQLATPTSMWGGGTGETLIARDMLRRSNVETRQAWLEVQRTRADVQAQVSALAKQVGELVAEVRSLRSGGPAVSIGGGLAPVYTFTGTATPKSGA